MKALRDFLDEEIALAERAAGAGGRPSALREDQGRLIARETRSGRLRERRRDLGDDRARGGRRVGRVRDRAADDEEVRARADRVAGRRDALLVARGTLPPGRTPGTTRKKPGPHAARIAAISSGEHTTPSRPASFASTARRRAASRGVPASPTA